MEENYDIEKNKTTIIKEYDDSFICRVESKEKGISLKQNIEVFSIGKLLEEYK